MKSEIKLSIIIVTYNNEETIDNCIESIYAYNDIGDALEIIVVDNCSDDSTNILLQEYESQGKIKYVLAKENKGFGAGNNLGANLAIGEYLFFLNPDTELIEPIFSKLLNELEFGTPICGFHLVSKDGHDMPSFGAMPENIHVFYFIKIKYFILKFTNLRLKKFFPWGAAFALTKQKFVAAGKFDENFFLNFEEPDLIYRIKPKYIKILKKKIIHLESVSKPKGEQAMHFYFDSEKRYFSKYDKLNYSNYKKVNYIKLKLKKILFGNRKISAFEQAKIEQYRKEF